MTEEDQKRETALYELLFSVRRSVRYHVRRRQYFDRLDKFIKIFTAIGGIGTVTTMLAKANEWWTLSYGTAAGLFSLIDLVIGTNELARLHCDLSKEFIELEKEMVLAGESAPESDLKKFTVKRLEIEAKEPPALRVLDTICHNDLVRAMGLDRSHQKRITCVQKFLSPICDWRLESSDKSVSK